MMICVVFVSFIICLITPVRFTQTFIDIREKEKKRGTRGLVSIPAKYPKIIERLLHALNDSTKSGVMLNETDTILRPEDLEKLQDKIAKEIANSNLNPKEITDLQVRAYVLRVCLSRNKAESASHTSIFKACSDCI